jgi:GntR family transcriptional repressor for pyruvate dehydrogenase complex
MLCSEFARIEQFIEIRKSIEAVSAAEAAQKATAEDLAKIQGALRELLEAIQTGRLLEDGGLAFHLAIVEAAHNPSLIHVFQICATLMRSTQGITNLTRDAATARENYVGHEAISRAIRARDPVQARERMLSHLDAAKRAIHYLNPLLHRRPAL